MAGPLPKPDARWAAEASLDAQMVSAACPNCKILLVEADSDFASDLFIGVAASIALGSKIVSNSYGSPEYAEQAEVGEMLNHPGVVLTVASGDSGYGAGFPASSPYVTAVGGTSLRRAANNRGWAETTWLGAGSGCSAYEKKPGHQTDAGCQTRTIADVAAVADPQTGVAVYNTYQTDGWQVYGGTSAAAPIIAGVYALAGDPVAGSRPSIYPYRSPSALNDVTGGANGACEAAYLCKADHGYDGPTGLGTPNGIGAFAPPKSQGRVTGTVTDGTTERPVPAARVNVGTAVTYTALDGRYSLDLPAGSHQLSVASRGFHTRTLPAVTVEPGATTAADVALEPIPPVTVSGMVWDGSGHGWSLYASIMVDGQMVFTDPSTGFYTLRLLGGRTHTLLVTPRYPGYRERELTVEVGESDKSFDIALFVDPETCEAPGYARASAGGLCEPVEGGMVIGHVRNAVTGVAVNGAIVRSPDRPTETAMSLPTPDDDRLEEGFYWLFTTLDGTHSFGATRSGFIEQPVRVTVVAENTIRADLDMTTRWTFPTGRPYVDSY